MKTNKFKVNNVYTATLIEINNNVALFRINNRKAEIKLFAGQMGINGKNRLSDLYKIGDQLRIKITKITKSGELHGIPAATAPEEAFLHKHKIGKAIDGHIVKINGPLMTIIFDNWLTCTTSKVAKAYIGGDVCCRLDGVKAKENKLQFSVISIF